MNEATCEDEEGKYAVMNNAIYEAEIESNTVTNEETRKTKKEVQDKAKEKRNGSSTKILMENLPKQLIQ